MIVSEIEKLLEESAELPVAEQLLRAELCFESRQLDHAEALYSFIKVLAPGNPQAYIGLAQTIAGKRRFEEALLELVDARKIIAAQDAQTNESMDDFLYACCLYSEIEQKRGTAFSDFRRLILEGLKLRAEGSHEEAQRVFFDAARKTDSAEEKDEVQFYIITLHKLSPTIIEGQLQGFKIPTFFNRFSESERNYLRKQFVRISDNYRPWGTEEELMKYHVRPRQPFSSEDAKALDNINCVEDLGI